MRTKGKLLVCGLIFVSGAVLNLFFSTAVHGLLTRKITRLSLLPIGDCLASLFSSRQHMMLYLCLQGFVCVLAVMFFLTNMRPYESDLDTITPEIKTPKAVDVYKRQGMRHGLFGKLEPGEVREFSTWQEAARLVRELSYRLSLIHI